MKIPSIFHRRTILGQLFAALFLIGFSLAAHAIERINLDSMGNESTSGVALPPSVSADGKYVVFSTNSALVPSDTDSNFDIYLRDLDMNTISRISVTPSGGNADGTSDSPVISADGKFVAFRSDATNLIGTGNDTNGIADVFVRDLVAGTTTRVSVASGGTQSNGAFGSGEPSITGDGRYVVFSSSNTDLVAMDTNSNDDIFLHDRNTGNTSRVNVGPMSAEATGGTSSAPVIADNGSIVAFRSFATNLVPGVMSGNSNIYGRDLMTNTTFLISKTNAGAEPDIDCNYPDVSADGNLVVYESIATNLNPADSDGNDDIYLFNRSADTTTQVSTDAGGATANGFCNSPRISGDGNVVGFVTDSTNLLTEPVDAIYDIYSKDLTTGAYTRVTIGHGGVTPDTDTYSKPDFTSNGAAVVFESPAGNLVANDTNMTHDIFIDYLAQPRPDNLISKNAAIETALGNDIYNTTGAGQKVTLVSRRAKTVRANLFAQNDSSAPDTFTVRGSGGNRYFKISYFRGATNFTAAIKQGVFTTDSIAPTAHETFRVSGKPSRSKLKKVKKKRGRRKTIWLKKNYTARLTSTSTTNTEAKDTAALLIKHR